MLFLTGAMSGGGQAGGIFECTCMEINLQSLETPFQEEGC